jgi:hypothetical protein
VNSNLSELDTIIRGALIDAGIDADGGATLKTRKYYETVLPAIKRARQSATGTDADAYADAGDGTGNDATLPHAASVSVSAPKLDASGDLCIRELVQRQGHHQYQSLLVNLSESDDDDLLLSSDDSSEDSDDDDEA